MIEPMLRSLSRHGDVAVCGTCMDACGIAEVELVDRCRRSTLDLLVEWTHEADKVLVF